MDPRGSGPSNYVYSLRSSSVIACYTAGFLLGGWRSEAAKSEMGCTRESEDRRHDREREMKLQCLLLAFSSLFSFFLAVHGQHWELDALTVRTEGRSQRRT